MKKLSLVLALMLVFGMVGSSLAESTESTTFTEADLYKENCDFTVIEADGDQPRLSYMAGVTNILEVDGLKFKDMNDNGVLDVYEDYRQNIDARIEDLISQMTIEEEAGLLYCESVNLDAEHESSMALTTEAKAAAGSLLAADIIPEFKVNCMLFNLNGTPIEVTNTLNNLQSLAEKERLSIPMVITSDREYNAWGGYIDKSQQSFGFANDPQLAYDLAYFYGKAMLAVGVHVTFEPMAVEIGAQYGENPELIASIIDAEVRGLEDSGFASCTKHWIGRGGEYSFGAARSIAQNFDNWMVGWKAAINAGAEWIMTNCGGTGITNTTDVKWDKVTMSYLRDTLQFDGIVVTDWWALGYGTKVSGVTNEGVELFDQSPRWLYNEALKNGVDMFGASSIYRGEDISACTKGSYPDILINGLKDGDIEKQWVDRAATRVLKFKFKKGLFEDPYNSIDEMLEVCASSEWAKNQTEITTSEELRAARNPEEVALTEKLEAECAVLIKNDNNLLPLQKGVKVYIESSNDVALESFKKYIGEVATIVDDIAQADVAIGDFVDFNDAAEQFVDDVKTIGKPIILTMNKSASEYSYLTPDIASFITNSDAFLLLTYNAVASHGNTERGIVTTTEPWVYKDLLFGEAQPGGIVVKEVARDNYTDALQWRDLAGDQGVSPYIRLMVQATMEDDSENYTSPNNWGDPLIQAMYGMKYGEMPEFEYSCLILPQVVETYQTSSWGSEVTAYRAVNTAKANEPFTVYALLRNNGGDGITTAQVKDGETVVGEKIMTVCGGSWRVIQMEITLDTVGEHTISLGGLMSTLTVTE